MNNIEIKKILFPVDLSESSEKIVPYVKIMTKKFQAALFLLFVVRKLEYYESICVPGTAIVEFEDSLWNGANQEMEEFIKEHFKKNLTVHPEIVRGDASEEIINYSYEKDIDLIIMGTHGRKGLDRALFGSVAQRVVRNSSIPVFVINPYRKEKEEKRSKAQA